MRTVVGSFALLMAVGAAAEATLVVVIPASQSTVVCTDRRIVGSRGTQFDSVDKLQLLTPRAIFFVTGLEGVSARNKLVYSPEVEFRKFLEARSANGIPPDQAIRKGDDIAAYLRKTFEQFLKDYRLPAPAFLPVAISSRPSRWASARTGPGRSPAIAIHGIATAARQLGRSDCRARSPRCLNPHYS